MVRGRGKRRRYERKADRRCPNCGYIDYRRGKR